MANMEWSKTDCSQRHSHCEQHPRHQWNVSNFWHRQNVPKTQPCHQQRTQRNRVKPPDLLRLNSVGESVEEFPNSCPKRRQFCARLPKNFSPPQHHQQANSDFVGKFWNKVREPVRTRHNLRSAEHSAQFNSYLDQLADKFSGNFDIDPQKFQTTMMDPNQEVGCRPGPVVTYGGGPYIKCESKGSTTVSTRTFPAYYRFLSFAHFHPYNNFVQNRMLSVPPFQQHRTSPSRWLETVQHQTFKKNPCYHMVNGTTFFANTMKKSYDQHKMKHNKSADWDRMMQNRSAVSHQHGQHRASVLETKPAKNCKQKQAAQSNTPNVTNEYSISSSKRSNPVLKIEVQTIPCEKTCELQSQSRLIDPLNSTNISQDKSSNQQGHVDSVHKKAACAETDCFCSSADTAKLFELKPETCNTNESDACKEKVTDSDITDTQNAAEHEGRSNEKQMHSTIAYLLGDYKNDTPTCSNDSDFSDVDYDNEDLDDSSQEILDSFMQPNNPVYTWKCLSKSSTATVSATTGSDQLNPEVGHSLTLNDSGTVLELTSDEGTTNSQSDVSDIDAQLSDESSDSGCDQQEISDSQNPTSNLYDPMARLLLETNCPLKVSKGTANAIESPETTLAQLNNSNKAAVLELCPHSTSVSSQIHPSLSFILGLDKDNEDSVDGSDTEDSADSDDADYDQLWHSFESSSDPYNPINGYKFQSSSLGHQSTESHECADANFVLKGNDEFDRTPKSSCDSAMKSSATGCLKKDIGKERVKKVSFCKEPIIISPELSMWEEEYMEARRGHWEEYARDRCRFQRRIRQAEFIISPYLTPEHRAKIVVKLAL